MLGSEHTCTNRMGTYGCGAEWRQRCEEGEHICRNISAPRTSQGRHPSLGSPAERCKCAAFESLSDTREFEIRHISFRTREQEADCCRPWKPGYRDGLDPVFRTAADRRENPKE
ncbi:Protein Tasor 2 [Manis pentadactyla]|nr:Protein Tasor 2 [Manis pentadactyla]